MRINGLVPICYIVKGSSENYTCKKELQATNMENT